MIDFLTMDIATLTRSVTGKGVRYLELFLKEYTRVFNTKVNASCPKCLQGYLTKYKNHFLAMANTSQYRLHAKYENIPLQFGSPILINNANITDEYAEILLQRPGAECLFAKMPSKEPVAARTMRMSAEVPANDPSVSAEPQNTIEGADDFDLSSLT
ncbi:hypothetical protein GR160_08675 [Flavobacterium sp. Sd200]|uniref:hypothetical protein n=1 Tax=Flavobacterium sp. Sd200 TaxID=2692211 RepID=UPI00136EB1F9|nr:hypothetical protein [Flavobacterium sp. Sd200]MXN91301.1 hypothetical protein [Flavobacterium sp. Sd200]